MKKEFRILLLIIAIFISMRIWGPQDSLDARIYYTSGEASDFLSHLNSDEIAAYVRNQFLDFGLIFAYSSLFWLLSRRHHSQTRILQWFSLVPGSFDLIETTLILSYLFTGEFLFGWDDFGIMTFFKWTTGSIFLLAVLLKALKLKFPSGLSSSNSK